MVCFFTYSLYVDLIFIQEYTPSSSLSPCICSGTSCFPRIQIYDRSTSRPNGSRGKGFPSTIFGNLVKVFTVILYVISTIHLALAMKQNFEAFAVDENADEVFADQAGDIVIAHLAMELVNVRVLHVGLVYMIPLTDMLQCIIADMILIWRAWVLWNRDWRIVILLCVLLVGSSGAFFLRLRTLLSLLWFCSHWSGRNL